MDLKNYSTGVQHIGIPTNDIDKTVEFYHKLGFETAFETVNEEANEKVVFLKLGTLVVETYENHAAKMEHGAIDHVALDVRDIEEIFRYINEAGFLYVKIILYIFYFLTNINHTSFIADTCTHQTADRSNHTTNIILALLSRHPVDRIQYIIKKMR